MLHIMSPFDVQIELAQFVKTTRKKKKLSVKRFSQMTGVPDSTIRKFEKTGEISLRQFLAIYAALGDIADLQKLTQVAEVPKSLDQVLADA